LQAVGADVRHLPFGDGMIDIIVSNSTLDHFRTRDELVASLEELGRVSRSGGELIVTLDNPTNPVVGLRNMLPFQWLHGLGILPYYVGVTLGVCQLRDILQRLGFDVVEDAAFIHFPRVIAVWIGFFLDRYASVGMQTRFLRFLTAFEHLSNWPTRFLTGYFVAVRAVKR
jgi:SAM-dependent methyltransferase